MSDYGRHGPQVGGDLEVTDEDAEEIRGGIAEGTKSIGVEPPVTS